MTTAVKSSVKKRRIKHVESTRFKIYETKDYDMFVPLKGQRSVKLWHVARLAKSMEEFGMLVDIVTVNENLEVINGLQRLAAAKQAKETVYYVIVKGYGIREMKLMNKFHLDWSTKDSFESGVDLGIPAYLELKKFHDKFSEFSLNSCIAMCSGIADYSARRRTNYQRVTGFGRISNFDDGTWVPKDIELAEIHAGMLREIGKYFKKYNESRFVGAMLVVFRHPQFEGKYNRFLNNLAKDRSLLYQCARRDQYVELVEKICNMGKGSTVVLRY